MFKILTAQTLVLLRVSWLSSLVYFLLTSPDKIYTNVCVLVLGTGLNPSTGTGSEGLVSVLLSLLVVDDLMRLTGPKPLTNFMDVLPVRLLLQMTAGGLSYLVKWRPLATTPCFAFLFYDTIITGLTFLAVRDELNESNKAQVRESRGYVGDL